MDFGLPITLEQLNVALYAVFALFIAFGLLRGFAEGFRKSIVHLVVMVGLIAGSFYLAQMLANSVLTTEIMAIDLNGTTYQTLGALIEGLITTTPFISDILASDAGLANELIQGISVMVTRVSLFVTFITASLFVAEPIVSGLINLIITPFVKIAGKKKPKFLSRLFGAVVAGATTIVHVGVLVSPIVALRSTASSLFNEDPAATCFGYVNVEVPAEVCESLVTYGEPIDTQLLTPQSEQLFDTLTAFTLDGNTVNLRDEFSIILQIANNPDLPLSELASLDLASLSTEQIDALGNSIALLGESNLISPFFPALISYLFNQAGLGDYLTGLDLEGEVDWASELSSIADAITILATLNIAEGFDVSNLNPEDLTDLLTAVGGSEIMQEVVANALNEQTAALLGDGIEVTFWSEVDFAVAAEVATVLIDFNTTEEPTQQQIEDLVTILAENEDFITAVVNDFDTNDITFPATEEQIAQMQTTLENSDVSQEIIDQILSLFAPQ